MNYVNGPRGCPGLNKEATQCVDEGGSLVEPAAEASDAALVASTARTSAHDPCAADGGSKATLVACFHPVHGWRGRGGTIVSRPPNNTLHIPASRPCGNCIGCRTQHLQGWALRALHEAQLHNRNSFITTTYDDEHLPSNGSLDLADMQRFFKAVRKKCGPFRYYHVGEYTDDDRPHYHALIFGLNWAEDREYFRTKNGHRIYTSPTLENLWPHGFHTIGELNYKTAQYVTRYVLKKINGKRQATHYMRVNFTTGEVKNLKPEYATMSRRPGIASNWIEKYSSDVYPKDFLTANGRKYKPPKFYDARFELEHEDELELIKKKRRLFALQNKEDNTQQRLEDKEQCMKAKLNLAKREL